MATRTKTKPKTATAKGKGKGKAAHAAKTDAKPKAPAKVLEVGQFVKFGGYKGEVPDHEAAFEKDETLVIVEVDDAGDDGILYSCVVADDYAEYQENGDENVRGGQVAPSEVSELKGSALDKAREQFIPVHMIGKLADLTAENDSMIEVAVELNAEIQQNYFYLGGALARILQTGEYLKEHGGDYEGDDAFNDFCQENFGFKASKGRQLARIYMTFANLPDFDPSDLADIGWSIASKIEKYVTPDNVDEVLEAAKEEGVTQRTVDQIMQEKFVTAEGKTASGRAPSRGEKLVTKTLSYKFSEDSAESVEIAITQCMKQYGIQSPELALERICVEWAQDHVETKTAKQRIQAKANKAAKAREAQSAPKDAAETPKRGRKKAA